MTNKISTNAATVAKLTQWDIASVMGSWNFAVNAALINNIIRALPPVREASGVDSSAEYLDAVRHLINHPDQQLTAYRGVQTLIQEVMDNYTTLIASSMENTLAFMLTTPPTSAQFEREYDHRKKNGGIRITMKQFVESELAQAKQRFETLRNHGGEAIMIANQIEVGDPDTAPEWLVEAFHDKMHDKLAERWAKLEIRSSNPRIKQSDRDEAVADQLAIETVIGYCPAIAVPPEDDEEYVPRVQHLPYIPPPSAHH